MGAINTCVSSRGEDLGRYPHCCQAPERGRPSLRHRALLQSIDKPDQGVYHIDALYCMSKIPRSSTPIGGFDE